MAMLNNQRVGYENPGPSNYENPLSFFSFRKWIRALVQPPDARPFG